MSYVDYYIGRRVISDMLIQHDIGSAQPVNSPKYLICAHQTKNRIDTPNKKIIAIFDKLDLRKYCVEIDGLRYSRDTAIKNYTENDCPDQYKDFKIFLKTILENQH